MSLFFVYILRSSSNQLYIGQTNNIHNREKQQINKTKKAAKFIKDGEVFRLVYSEKYETRLEAMRREKQLKGWTRVKKEALILGNLELLKNFNGAPSKAGSPMPTANVHPISLGV